MAIWHNARPTDIVGDAAQPRSQDIANAASRVPATPPAFEEPSP